VGQIYEVYLYPSLAFSRAAGVPSNFLAGTVLLCYGVPQIILQLALLPIHVPLRPGLGEVTHENVCCAGIFHHRSARFQSWGFTVVIRPHHGPCLRH